jgi:hypothetical protein
MEGKSYSLNLSIIKNLSVILSNYLVEICLLWVSSCIGKIVGSKYLHGGGSMQDLAPQMGP